MRRVRGLEDARAALAAGECALISEPFAACYAGVNYFQVMLKQLRDETPDFSFALCCGDDAAIAHDALRMGFADVICDCGDGQFMELQAIATLTNTTIRRR